LKSYRLRIYLLERQPRFIPEEDFESSLLLAHCHHGEWADYWKINASEIFRELDVL